MKATNKNEFLFGLIFTIILFLILDYIVPEADLLLRVGIILILLLLGRFLFGKFFSSNEDV